jgi:hypothetical protein
MALEVLPFLIGAREKLFFSFKCVSPSNKSLAFLSSAQEPDDIMLIAIV